MTVDNRGVVEMFRLAKCSIKLILGVVSLRRKLREAAYEKWASRMTCCDTKIRNYHFITSVSNNFRHSQNDGNYYMIFTCYTQK